MSDYQHTSGTWKKDGLFVRASRGIICKTYTPQEGGTFDAEANTTAIAALPCLI